jgi:gliding motility-associated-like protein
MVKRKCTEKIAPMLDRYRYNLLLILVSLSCFSVAGQMTMPDNVSVGQTRQYYVYPNPGSTYTWWIDGVVQTGFDTNEFIYTWNTTDTFLLEVQERSSEGCSGPVRSGQVYVSQLQNMKLNLPEAFSPNGDLINDCWNIGNYELYPEMEVAIFNRWGQLLWKSGKGYPQPWDGKNKGTALPVDSYHYVIDLHDGSKPVIGSITIVR